MSYVSLCFHFETDDAFLKTLAPLTMLTDIFTILKVQVGNDQKKAQSEKDSHSKNRGGKNTKTNNKVIIP